VNISEESSLKIKELPMPKQNQTKSTRVPQRAALYFGGVIFFALVLAAPSVRAATIVVTGTGDTLSNNGVCSIREAIINANNNAATWPDCAAGSGTDTIVLPAGTITLSIPNTPSSFSAEEQSLKGDLDITSSMIISGNAAGTTINGAALDRIFDINPDTDGDFSTPTPAIVVTINNLTITNGRQNDVGAIRVQANATVTMSHCTVSNSVSWANDAGGIGVLSGATLSMNNCTISGNSALLLDGGIKNEGSLNLTSCTITNNNAVHNRGHGLGCSGTVCNVRNTIIAGNGAAVSADTEGSITSLGYNIIGKITDDLGNPITNVTATTGDQFGVTAAQVHLGPLANNGGPTPTHALLAPSIAIDKGHSSGLSTDQRGLVRPCDNPAIANAVGGDGADVGAFEVQGACDSAEECCCRRTGRGGKILVGTCCPTKRPIILRQDRPR
jgi:CSLREA domain-containing protein